MCRKKTTKHADRGLECVHILVLLIVQLPVKPETRLGQLGRKIHDHHCVEAVDYYPAQALGAHLRAPLGDGVELVIAWFELDLRTLLMMSFDLPQAYLEYASQLLTKASFTCFLLLLHSFSEVGDHLCLKSGELEMPANQNVDSAPSAVAAAIDKTRRVDHEPGVEVTTGRTELEWGRTAPPLQLRTEVSAIFLGGRKIKPQLRGRQVL